MVRRSAPPASVMTAVPLLTGITGPLAGALSDRIGSRLLSSAGLLVSAVALAGLAVVGPTHGLVPVVLILAAAGFGSGIFQTPNTSAIMGSVPPRCRGIAAGMQATCRNIGMVAGVAMASAIVGTIAPGGTTDPELWRAIRVAYLAGAVAALVGAGVSMFRGGHPGPETSSPERLHSRCG